MEFDRGIVLASALLIVVLALASGPLVGAFEIADAGGEDVGSGTATVTVTDAPETATLSRGQHGADFYVLRVPSATIEISALSGNPTAEYSLRVDELGYQRSSVHFLGNLGMGQHLLQIERDELPSNRIDQEIYEGHLKLVVRGDESEVILDQPVIVEVEE